MSRKSSRAYVIFLLGLLGLVGCGGVADRPRLAQVDVLITYKGVPLEQGSIRFEFDGGRPAVGTILAGRVSEMTTFESGDGVPIGSHRIAIESYAPTDNPMSDPPKPLIPMKYANAASSGLTANVRADDPNEFRFELTD